MSRPRTAAELVDDWRRTGYQDYANVGDTDEVAREAGVKLSDDLAAAKRKISRWLLSERAAGSTAMPGGYSLGDCLSPGEEHLDAADVARRCYEAWAESWAGAAAPDCLKYLRRERDEET